MEEADIACLEEVASVILQDLQFDDLSEALVLEAIIDDPTSILESIQEWPITRERATQHLMEIEQELEIPRGALSQIEAYDSLTLEELSGIVRQRVLQLRDSLASRT
jgi:hypothetical protein